MALTVPIFKLSISFGVFPFFLEIAPELCQNFARFFLARFCHFADDLLFLTFAGSSSRTSKGKEPAVSIPRRSARSSNPAMPQAWEKVQFVERNIEECDSLNRDEMRQRLITLKGEEFYQIMVSNRPWVMNDQTVLPKPTLFFGDAVPDDVTYQRRCF